MYAVLALVLFVQPLPKDQSAWRESVIKDFGLKPNANDPPLRKLQKERCLDRVVAAARTMEIIDIGNSSFEPPFADYIELYDMLADNLAELAEKPADKVKCYEMCVEQLKEIEKMVQRYVMWGIASPQMFPIARAARIDAEIELLKLKESLKAGK